MKKNLFASILLSFCWSLFGFQAVGSVSYYGNFYGNGAGLTNLPPNVVTNRGTQGIGYFDSVYPFTGTNTPTIDIFDGTFLGSWTFANPLVGNIIGNGAGLTNLQATNLVGTVPASKLPLTIITNDVINPEANAYLSAAGIWNPNTRKEVDSAITEMKLGNGQNYFTNCVGLYSFQSRLGANFNIVGSPLTFKGATNQNVLGLVFSGSTTCSVALPTITSNYTVAVRYKITQANTLWWQNNGGGTPIWILKDTNGNSADAFCNETGGGRNEHIETETNGGSIQYVSIYHQLPNQWGSQIEPWQANQICYVRNNNTNFAWINSDPAAFSGTPTYSNPAFNTNQFNQLILGGDSTITGVKAAQCEVDTVAVFNTALSSNQQASLYRAMSWLMPGNRFDLVVGDSRCSLGSYSSAGLNYWCDWPSAYYNASPLTYFVNRASSGSTSRNATNGVPLGCVTNLASKYTPRVLEDFGVNDFYANSDNVTQVESNIVSALTPAKNYGARISVLGVYDVAVSNANWTYSLANWTNIQQLNLFWKTNGFADDYYPLDSYITQGMLATNRAYLYSIDGVHFGYTDTNTIVVSRIGVLTSGVGKPWASVYGNFGYVPLFDPTNTPASGNTIRYDGTNWYFAN